MFSIPTNIRIFVSFCLILTTLSFSNILSHELKVNNHKTHILTESTFENEVVPTTIKLNVQSTYTFKVKNNLKFLLVSVADVFRLNLSIFQLNISDYFHKDDPPFLGKSHLLPFYLTTT